VNRSELETLVKLHQAEIFRYLRYLGADRTTAEDLTQETFLAAFQSSSAPAADDARALAAWLRGIARNLFRAHCRRSRTSPVRADSESLKRAEAVWTSDFLRDGDGFETMDALHRCLDGLPQKQREAVRLHYAERKPREEMARRFQMTADGIKSLLRRIRTALAECIGRRLNTEGVR